MKLVILESPYAEGDLETNIEYAREAMLDCLKRGESPMVSHLLYTQVLDDTNPLERDKGMVAGMNWYRVAEKAVVYEDFGISRGMEKGIQWAETFNVPVEYRKIKGS